MINDEQISRFFNQQCDPEEAEQILNFLEEHPEELEKYMSYREWENFQTRGKVGSSLSGKLWSKIAAVSLRKKPYYYVKVCSAVACVAIAVCVVSLWLRQMPQKEAHPKEAAIRAIQNTGKDTMSVKLLDDTHVKLSVGSTLTYSKLFARSERNVGLQGWAYFRVTHGTIPFIVHTDVLMIKDLGTTFSIQSFEKDSIIKIALYEGSVLVSSVEDSDRSFSLKPGDILIYNKQHKKFSLYPQRHLTAMAVNAKNKTTNKHYKPDFAGNNWYMFNNQALSGVFDQLGKIYNVRIFYADSTVRGMTFIGRLDKTDTLEEVLKSIASLNHLKVEKTDEGYYIHK